MKIRVNMKSKRGKQFLVFIFLFVIVLSVAFVSAGFFSDLWNRAASNSQQFSPYTCENIGSLADVNLDGSVNLIDMALVKSLNGCVPQVQQFCVDTDGGKNYFTKGTLTNSSGTFDDKCEGLTGDGLSEQYCSGNISLTEYKSCYSLGNYYCSNGACVLNQTATCTDTDGGKNYYVKGTLVNGNNTAVDYCSGANANGLIEFYCNGSSFIQDFLPSCTSLGNYMCQNGACILNQTNSSQII